MKQIGIDILKYLAYNAIVLIYIKGSIFNVNLKELVDAATIATLPLIVNYLNPKQVNYGIKNKKQTK